MTTGRINQISIGWRAPLFFSSLLPFWFKKGKKKRKKGVCVTENCWIDCFFFLFFVSTQKYKRKQNYLLLFFEEKKENSVFSCSVDLFFGLKVLNAAHVYCVRCLLNQSFSCIIAKTRFLFFWKKEKICSPQGIAKLEREFFFSILRCLWGRLFRCAFFLFVVWVLCAKA